MNGPKVLVILSVLGLAAVAPAPIQTHDPAAAPRERNMSDAERLQQQSAAPVVNEIGDPGLKPDYTDGRYTSDPSGEDAIKSADTRASDGKKIDGEGALKQAASDVVASKKRPWWRLPLMLFGFAVVGFGALMWLRNWADKNAPPPPKDREKRKREW